MTAPETSVAVELAELRGEIRTGLTEIKGSLRVLVERTDRTAEDVRQLREDHDQDVAKLRAEVEELKKARWPLPSLAAVVSVAALSVALYEAAGR